MGSLKHNPLSPEESSKRKDYENCPFCQSERDGYSTGWSLSPEGWDQMKKRHDENHTPEESSKNLLKKCGCHCHADQISGVQCRCIKNCIHCTPPKPVDDTKPFKHGEEGTHYACQEMMDKLGDKVGCCGCNHHDCSIQAQPVDKCKCWGECYCPASIEGLAPVVPNGEECDHFNKPDKCTICLSKKINSQSEMEWEEELEKLIKGGLLSNRYEPKKSEWLDAFKYSELKSFISKLLQKERDLLAKKIIGTGHNNDCLFCGFKDKIALSLKQTENKGGEEK